MSVNRIRKVLIVLSFLLYLISLFQIGYNNVQGMGMAIFGTIFMLRGGIYLAWLANPFLIFAWLFNEYTKKSFIASLVCLGLQLWVLTYSTAESNELDEMASMQVQIELGVGYYLWVASCLVMIFSNAYQLYAQNQQRKIDKTLK